MRAVDLLTKVLAQAEREKGGESSPAEGHARGKVLRASWFCRAALAFITLCDHHGHESLAL